LTSTSFTAAEKLSCELTDWPEPEQSIERTFLKILICRSYLCAIGRRKLAHAQGGNVNEGANRAPLVAVKPGIQECSKNN
jgi:hypothetical protein